MEDLYVNVRFMPGKDNVVKASEVVGLLDAWPEALSDWEERFAKRYTVDVRRIRMIMEESMRFLQLSRLDAASYRFRFCAGIFDSVHQFFKLGSLVVPTLVRDMQMGPLQVPFRVSLMGQPEYIYANRHYGAHEEMSMATAQNYDLSDRTILMREKLNGTPFFQLKGLKEGERWMAGAGVCFRVPDPFAVEMAELISGEFRVLKPYGLPDFSFESVYYKQHAWVPVSASAAYKYGEGVFFLRAGIETRCKRIPTIDIDATGSGRVGVWEVGLSYDGKQYALRYLGARPGKKAYDSDPMEALLSKLPLSSLQWPIETEASPVTLKVCVKQNGAFVGTWVDDGKTITIDSGWRMTDNMMKPAIRGDAVPSGTVEAVLFGDVFNYVSMRDNARRMTIMPFPIHTDLSVFLGVKCLFFGNDAFYLFKDKEKDLDFIGGKVEEGESTAECLAREMEEEAGLVGVDARRLAVSIGTTETTHFVSVIYIAPMGKMKPGFVRVNDLSLDGIVTVPWVPRLIQAVRQVCAGHALYDVYQTLSAPMVYSARMLMGEMKKVRNVKSHPPIKWDRYVQIPAGAFTMSATVSPGEFRRKRRKKEYGAREKFGYRPWK